MSADNATVQGMRKRLLVDAQSVNWPAVVVCYATTVADGANVLVPVTAGNPLPTTGGGGGGGGNAAAGATGSAVPADADYVGVNIGGNLTGVSGKMVGGATGQCVDVNSVGGAALALGQQLAAASVPVVLTAAQLTTLTSLSTVTANQGGAPWAENITQFGGTNLSTGTGAGGNGIPRVTVSNDSAVKLWDGTTAAAVDTVGGVKITPTPTSNQTGPSQSKIKAAASDNATNVKNAAGQLYGYDLSNNTASNKWLKLYNKASAPTSGDTPAATILIPANGGRNVEWKMGLPYGTGIGYRITGGVAENDATNTAVDDVTGFLLYK